MMNLSISKCVTCGKTRLVDKTVLGFVCFACKQKHNKSH